MLYLFDLGGVVIHGGEPNTSTANAQAFERAFKIKAGAFNDLKKTWYHNWADFCRGLISEDEFWQRYLKDAGARQIDVAKAKGIYRDLTYIDEAMLALVKGLGAKARVAALTNISHEWLKFYKQAFDIERYFSPIVASCELGVAKPDKAAFEASLEILSAQPGCADLQTKPEEVIFIDNSDWNMAPARELGMKAILFTAAEDLKKKIFNL